MRLGAMLPVMVLAGLIGTSRGIIAVRDQMARVAGLRGVRGAGRRPDRVTGASTRRIA